MLGEPVRLSLPSYAKVNLVLEVLNKRPDGFHNIRTIFHTISLADRIEFAYEPSDRIELSLQGNVEIPNNLILRAARAALEHLQQGARIEFTLEKKIPMGGGLGGGSSNAATVLIAIAALAKRPVWDFLEMASNLGSDVPFFFYGGCALGLGRGTELYPMPDVPPASLLLVTPGIHVSTADAYGLLRRTPEYEPAINRSSRYAATMESGLPDGFNDFETSVFAAYPELARWKERLRQLGGESVLMSGSGSSLFCRMPEDRIPAAIRELGQAHCDRVALLSRTEYRQALQNALHS
jgi:4-diphosphocytidyl-2-C-methyl-D-erythritol kinase